MSERDRKFFDDKLLLRNKNKRRSTDHSASRSSVVQFVNDLALKLEREAEESVLGTRLSEVLSDLE
jgi:hypothetical protein